MEQKDEQLNELIFQMAKNEERYHKRLRHSACVIVATSLAALVCLMTLISLLLQYIWTGKPGSQSGFLPFCA